MTIIELARLTEDQAREYLEKCRWPNGPVCPHCESMNVTRLYGRAHRPGTIQCNECREQFTVKVGSVMESSHIPMVKWAMAFHLICSSKKGFSALQLQRELELGSYKTAWFMLHRIRHAMAPGGEQPQLKGVIEADETYVGGKPRVKGTYSENGTKFTGRGTKKTPVVALVERDGKAVCKPVETVSTATVRKELITQIEKGATLMTDELNVYVVPGREFASHERVHHGRKEYARKLESGLVAHTNTVESFFGLIKRGHYGVYHQMSKRHLHRYCAEFTFRWNHRKSTDTQRMEAAMAQVGGKRLLYETPS